LILKSGYWGEKFTVFSQILLYVLNPASVRFMAETDCETKIFEFVCGLE